MNPTNEGYDQGLLEFSESTNGVLNRAYLGLKKMEHNKSVMYLESIFANYNVDAIATPCYADETLTLSSYGSSAGYPSITVRINKISTKTLNNKYLTNIL